MKVSHASSLIVSFSEFNSIIFRKGNRIIRPKETGGNISLIKVRYLIFSNFVTTLSRHRIPKGIQ
jgi:hypothetical protein